MKAIKAVVVVAILVLVNQTSLWARWLTDGGSINYDNGQNASNASLAVYNGTPFIAWQETSSTTTQIYLKKWNGADWQQLGGSLNHFTSRDASDPSLAINSGIPYVAFNEIGGSGPYYGVIYVRHWTGAVWQEDGYININGSQGAANPNIAFSNTGILYIAWTESSAGYYQTYVKSFNGSTWTQLGGSLNVNTNRQAYRPKIAIYNNTPYVFWYEYELGNSWSYVKHWNGNAWLQDGASHVGDGTGAMSIAFSGSIPYILIHDSDQNYLKYLNGGSWEIHSQTGDANWLSISNGIYFILSPSGILKHWTGTGWWQDGDSYNSGRGLAAFNGTPYVAYNVDNPQQQLYVKHWTPDRLSYIDPTYKINGQTAQITIAGAAFNGPPVAKLTRSGSPDLVSYSAVQNSIYNYTYTFNLTGASPKAYDVKVTGTDGCVSLLKQAFVVLSPVAGPVVWNVNDLGAAGSLTETSRFSGLEIGDPDRDDNQELYVANLDQSLYQFKKFTFNWNITALPSSAGMNYCEVLLADGNDDQSWEIYTSGFNNHAYQFVGPSWSRTDQGLC